MNRYLMVVGGVDGGHVCLVIIMVSRRGRPRDTFGETRLQELHPLAGVVGVIKPLPLRVGPCGVMAVAIRTCLPIATALAVVASADRYFASAAVRLLHARWISASQAPRFDTASIVGVHC
jgi:hypothetical protein